jgi:prepilin-type N-terminal cleavage/methylation domain-containing protein
MKRQGITLVELLIALAILGILLGLASSSIIQYLGIQSDQEAATSAQAKLRRTTEIVSQELRGAILGAIINSPYSPSAQQLSVALLDGSAGYQVTSMTTTKTDVVSTAGIATSDLILIVGSNQQAALRTVTGVASSQLSHASCAVATLPNPLLFKVRTLGYSFDETNKRLLANEADSTNAVAFGISGFDIDYIYSPVNGIGAQQINPLGFPTRSIIIGGNTFTLDRLQVTVSAEEMSRGRTITKTFSSQIDLVDNSRFLKATNASISYSIQGVTVCP